MMSVSIFLRRAMLVPCAAGGALLLAGCHEPDYRNEVSSGPQGQVEVHRVAKDPPPVDMSAPPSAAGASGGFAPPANASAQPLPSASGVGASSPSSQSATEQRVAALEAQVRLLNNEVMRLKATQPPQTQP